MSARGVSFKARPASSPLRAYRAAAHLSVPISRRARHARAAAGRRARGRPARSARRGL